MNFDQQVRLAIYEMTVNDGRIPSIDELAESRHVDRERVAAAYRALADAHVIVLKPGTTDIWSAPPFSAVPTAFRVNPAKPGRSDAGRWWYAPCAWDAFGVPAVVRHDVHIPARCAATDAPLPCGVQDGSPFGGGIIHLEVPARHFWDDIFYT